MKNMHSTKTKPVWQKFAVLTGLTFIIVLVLILPYSGLFQADLSQTFQLHSGNTTETSSTQNINATNGGCQKLDTITLPQNPLPANTSAAIALNTTPENFAGPFTYSASSGEFNDGQGNVGSYIQTSAKKVDYSGGDDGTSLTIQAKGAENANCLVTIPVVQTSSIACAGLKIVSDPDPLPADQSANLTVVPTPDNFKGTYLFQADSGNFQMQDADVQANGNNTKTLVTKSTNVIYNGGKSGEKIVVKALGDNNGVCIATISITK